MTDQHNTAHETRATESSLEALGRADRAAAPSGLERRITDASLDAFRSGQDQRRAPAQTLRIRVVRAVFATAAVLAIAALAAIWSSARAPTSAPLVDATQVAATGTLDIVDSWLEGGPLNEPIEGLDDLFFAIAEFDPRSAQDWTVDDLLTLEGDSL